MYEPNDHKSLTPKQQRFVNEYLIHLNAAQLSASAIAREAPVRHGVSRVAFQTDGPPAATPTSSPVGSDRVID